MHFVKVVFMWKDVWKLFRSKLGAVSSPDPDLESPCGLWTIICLSTWIPGLFASGEIHQAEQRCSNIFAASDNGVSFSIFKKQISSYCQLQSVLHHTMTSTIPNVPRRQKTFPLHICTWLWGKWKTPSKGRFREVMAGLPRSLSWKPCDGGDCYFKWVPWSLTNNKCHSLPLVPFCVSFSPPLFDPGAHTDYSQQGGCAFTQPQELKRLEERSSLASRDHQHSTATLMVLMRANIILND